MGFIQDHLLPFLKTRELRFIQSYKECDDVYTFVFEKEDGLSWKAGQYGLFRITHKPIKNDTRPFSLSSAPDEDTIKITTRVGNRQSEFKDSLLELKQGMKLMMRGPVGSFYLKGDQPALLIAAGIGITPFRAMLKQLEDHKHKAEQHIQLLYLAGDHEHLFKDELDNIAQRATIDITYLHSREELYDEVNEFAKRHRDNAKYYIAGPKGMVDDVSSYVNKVPVRKSNIIKDRFFGY